MKKVLYGILGVLALLSLFIIACAFRPELADKVSDLLYADRGAQEPAEEEGKNGADAVSPSAGESQGTVPADSGKTANIVIVPTGPTSDEVLSALSRYLQSYRCLQIS